MKKTHFITAILALAFIGVNAQEGNALSKDSWIIELNTGTPGSTGFYFSSSDGNTSLSVGADAGYFIADKFALKAGLGFGSNFNDSNSLAYKIGVKYYLNEKIPLSTDFFGNSSGRSGIGLQAGYALFVVDRLSVEPSVRYNLGLDSSDFFQALVGVVFHL